MSQDLQELENELKKDPKLRRFYELAREYQKRGQLDEAALWCEKGLAVNPSQWQARILLAQVHLAKGRVLEARAQVEKVLLPLPDNVPANHLAADIYLNLGDAEKALRHYQVVELFDPGRAGVKEKIQELTGAAAGPPAGPPERAPEPAPAGESPVEVMELPPAPAEPAEALPEAVFDVQPLEVPPAPAQVPVEGLPSLSAEVLIETAEVTPPESEVLEAEEAAEEPPADLPLSEGEAEATVLSLQPPADEAPEAPIAEQGEDAWDVATDTFEQEILNIPAAETSEESGRFNTAELSQTPEEGPLEAPEAVAEKEAAPAPARASDEAVQEHIGAHEGPEEAFAEEELAAESADAPAFSTITLAELYEGQGYPEKAIEVYQRILLKDPENPQIRERVSRLLMRMAGETPDGPAVRPEDVQKAMRQKRVVHLRTWLRRVREARHV
jgi:tetratricopeptide (TPR) repeat protein